MDKKYDINPNTLESLERLYNKRWTPATERVNDWMMPLLHSLVPAGKDKKILEVGCGFGKTLSLLRAEIKAENRGCFKGVDISPTAVSKGNEYHSDITLECSNYEHSKDFSMWDMVICSQTLEHVDKPGLMIQKMSRALKQGGVLFITVPWPKGNLDNGVKSHYWRFYESDFHSLLPGCKIKRMATRMIIIWHK